MVFSQSTLVRSSKTSPISGYEKFQKGIFDVSELKPTFYMHSSDKSSPEKSESSSPNYSNGNSLKHSSETKTSTTQPPKVESKSPSSTSTSVENGSPRSSSNPLQNFVPRFAFGNEEVSDFSPVSSFPEFNLPSGDDLDTISIVNSLKQRMKYEGLSQTKVARSLGKGQATVSQILNNPKPWAMLTERGKDTYRLLKLWLDQQMLSEGEEGKTASYDERLQKLASVTGLPIDQVQKWLSFQSQDATSPHNGNTSLCENFNMKGDIENHTSPLFRDSPKNDMLLDLTRIRLKEEDILDLFKKAPDCEATEICTQYAERVNLWIARGNFLSTEEISGEVRREIEKHSISQGMFSQKILRRKQATLSEALCHPKPWGRLSDRGKLIYCFMKLWLLLPDERRLAPFKEESLQRFRQIPTQAIPVLEHEFKLYKGAPPKMVKEKLAEDLGLEYCTVTNFFSHCPSSNSLFKNDVAYSSCLPTMVKYPSPMDTLHSFKPDFHPQLPPLSPMGRVTGLNPLHPLTALHSQELQNGLLGRSKSFLLDANKDLDTMKIVAALKNRLRLLNISLQTFIDSVLLRKHNGTMVTLNELLLHPRPYLTLNPHQKEVFLTINHWLDRQPAEQLASISAFKPFDSLLFTSMEMTEIQNIISETHKFLKQYNLSQDKFATNVLSVRPEVLQDLFNSAPRTWTQLTHEQRNICHILKEWISDKEKFALFLDSQESKSPKVSRTSPLPSGSRSGSAANPFIFPNTSAVKTTLPLISSSLPLTSGVSLSSGVTLSSGVSIPAVRSPPTTIIQTLATSSTSVPAFQVGEGVRETTSPTTGSVKCEQGSSPMETSSPSKTPCLRESSPKSDTSEGGGSVSFPSYTDQTRSIGSQKYPRQECCHEAFHIMLQHVRETSSNNIMLCNHLEKMYKHLAPVKRDRTWTSPNTETDLENPMKRIRMSSPNS